MIYLLDTNICIFFLNHSSEPLERKLLATDPNNIAVCSIVKAELIYGALKSKKPVENLRLLHEFLEHFYSFAFDDAAAEAYGTIRSESERSGKVIGPNDLCIAAIAVANNLTVVTNNTKEFSRIEALQLEDWTT